MELRQYQYDAINSTYEAWRQGSINVGLVIPTGGGKTVVFSDIIAKHTGPCIAIAHRMELVSQISLTLSRYGIRHNIIAQRAAIREIVSLQIQEFGKRYYDPSSKCYVAGVDTLIRLDPGTAWLKEITLVIQDEGHHVLKNNKWGTAASLFPNALGLYPTATPCRTDGRGLGRHADGIIDCMVIGPTMRTLIKDGYLTDYRIFAPPSDLDLSQVPISAGGDYNNPKLRDAVHKSHITGDVVDHYLKIAPGKLGITFAVDVQSATEIAAAFRQQGIPAESISAKTPDLLRQTIMRRFRNREILQIVNVDLLGEGVDVPALEVVSMARPTQSYGLYSQQFGRALRPLPGKTHAIIIDHVDNVKLHGLPDAPREWTLDRRERKVRSKLSDAIQVKTCLNVNCFSVYEAYRKSCPYCGYVTPPKERSSPEHVEGDLYELDPSVLAHLRGEIARIDDVARIPSGLSIPAELAIKKRHKMRQEAQGELRSSISQWAGYHHPKLSDSEIYRLFFYTFGTDILTAQTLNTADAEKLKNTIDEVVNRG
jgi:superfamily II DNA or RNA helicase